MTASHLGRDETSGKEVFLLELGGRQGLGFSLNLPSSYFIGLIAWDATNASTATISEFCEQLIAAGCCCICCWGPGCERVHDIFDEVDVLRIVHEADDHELPVILSTWHERDSLEEMLDFVTMINPEEPYHSGCGCLVVITIDSREWPAEIKRKFMPS